MSSRFAFWTVALALAALVVARAFAFVWWPATHFDSDQAIVGLMAKHISEGRAFPLYYYGQNYMLAVEAYLAAPVMLVAGPTVTALKAPLVLINIAVVVLMLRVLVRESGLPAAVAAIAVLPLAVPAAGVAARVTEANGGNVEPWLYVVLLWMTRAHPWVFGAVLGFGMLHREFTAYGVVALLLMDGAAWLGGGLRRQRAAALARHWATAALAFLATRALAVMVRPFANGLGPGTRGDDPVLVATGVETMGGRLCVDPARWPARIDALVGDHLPRLVGGTTAPLRDYGVLTRVFSGQEGLGPWVGALTLLGLCAGAWHWLAARRAGGGMRPISHFGGYLVLVGTVSTLVYALATCSDIRVETMRYNLLGVMLPVGATVMALQTWRMPAARAGVAAAVSLWCAMNGFDLLALTRETMRAPLSDQRQALAHTLEQRGIEVAWARYGVSYHVTFLSQERVRLPANDFGRIRAYADEAARRQAPTIGERACPGGEPLQPGYVLCPAVPPNPDAPAGVSFQ